MNAQYHSGYVFGGLIRQSSIQQVFLSPFRWRFISTLSFLTPSTLFNYFLQLGKEESDEELFWNLDIYSASISKEVNLFNWNAIYTEVYHGHKTEAFVVLFFVLCFSRLAYFPLMEILISLRDVLYLSVIVFSRKLQF